MHPAIPKLLQLQERDQRIRQLQKDLKDVPNQQTRAKMQLAGDQAAVEAASQHVKEVEVKIKSIQLDVQTRQTTIKRLQDQQFETRKNDEFTALGHEIKRYQEDVTKLEDGEIEQMELLEGSKAKLKEAQAKLGETQKRVNEELKILDERAETIKKRLEELNAERKELSAPIEEDTLDLYTRIFHKKGDAAVVPMENAQCGGCHMKVVVGVIQSLKQSESLTHCESCGRILYMVE
jgi:predicted  nucleic acid-binding Zn-ribbon protein